MSNSRFVISDLPICDLHLQFVVLQCACRFIQARVFGSYAVYVGVAFDNFAVYVLPAKLPFGNFAVCVPPESVAGVGVSTVVVNLPKEKLDRII